MFNSPRHQLIIQNQSDLRTVNLESTTCSIGRDPENLIVLDSPKISRHHATLLRITSPGTNNHYFRIIDGDLNGKRSTNGIEVNGKSCFSYDLQNGDVITFYQGICATYQFIEAAAPVYAANPASIVDDPEDPNATQFFGNSSNSGRGTSYQTQSMSAEERQASIQQSLERLASFPELFSDPIVEIDLKGNITYLNPATLKRFPNLERERLNHPILNGVISLVKAEEKASVSREVVIGDRTFEQSIHLISASQLVRCYISDITERKRAEKLLRNDRNDLEERVAQRTLELAKSNQILKSQVAERKRAEDALRSSMATNKAILDAIPDLILRIDCKGTFVNYKAAKAKDLLTPERQSIGKHIYEVFPREISMPTMNYIEKAFATGEVQLLECQISHEGKVLSYEVRIAISDADEVMAIVRDITDRKQAEEDIRRTLEQEKKLNELKSRFVTMASHEFRTPLTSILSSAELLEHYSHKWSSEKQLKYLSQIQSSVNHMTELLNDVLLLGKADADRIKLSPIQIDLRKFCHDLVEEMSISAQTHQIIFNIECSGTNNSCVAYLDEKMLRHILHNLLSNAIKYSPEKDRVIFDLSCQSQQIVFKVEDFGIGVPPSEVDRLFDSFHRAENVGSIPGTGLGLPIVKRAVDLLRGKIEVDSQINIGTTFTVTLPNLQNKRCD